MSTRPPATDDRDQGPAPDPPSSPRGPLDEAAFDALYRQCVADVHGYVISLLGDRSAAEDVTAVAFERLYRTRSRLDHALARLAVSEGGFVQNSHVQVQQTGPSEADLTLKLPSAKLNAALAALAELAPVHAESQSLQDITNSYQAARRALADASANARRSCVRWPRRPPRGRSTACALSSRRPVPRLLRRAPGSRRSPSAPAMPKWKCPSPATDTLPAKG